MALTVKQHDEYKGDDWWNWAVWIEGSPSELSQVDHVVYNLHPTFPEPVRVCRDRDAKFELKSAGWGEFTILAKVLLKTGEQIRLTHDLALHYHDGTRTSL